VLIIDYRGTIIYLRCFTKPDRSDTLKKAFCVISVMFIRYEVKKLNEDPL